MPVPARPANPRRVRPVLRRVGPVLRRAPVEPPPWPAGWSIGEARSAAARTRGLLGRPPLGPREGLWLPVRSVHTVGMRWPLDLVWLGGDGTVVRIDPSVVPGRVRTSLRASGGVIETACRSGPVLAAALEDACGSGPVLAAALGDADAGPWGAASGRYSSS